MIDAELRDIPVILLPECPASVKTLLKANGNPYANIITIKALFSSTVGIHITKPQGRGLIKFLSNLIGEPVTKRVYKIRIDENNPKERLLALKYKLKEL